MKNTVSFGVNRTAAVDKSGMISDIWARWFGTSVIPAINNTTPLVIPGPYADDAAAKAGGVAIGSAYYKGTGEMVARLT